MNEVPKVPSWVRVACARWGSQKRRIWSGGDWFTDHEGKKQHHIDGYAESFLGKLLAERDGTGQGARRQHWPECMWGEGLEVQRNLPGMPILCFDVIHLRHVFDPEFGLTIKALAALVSIEPRVFWSALEAAEWWVWARLQPAPEIPLSVSAATPPIASIGFETGNSLHCPTTASRKTVNPDKLPELSLRSLHRPTLARPRR